MKLIGKFSFVKALFLAVGMLVLSSGMANAQSLVGKFTLPTEAHWKSVVLPAGEYTFTAEGFGATSMLVVRSLDSRHSVMLMPASIAQTAITNNDSLQLTHQGGEVFVTSFEMGSLGQVFYYPVPPAAAELASASQAASQPTMAKK